MSLPIFTTDDKEFSMMQTAWSSQLNKVLNNPAVNSNILQNIPLIAGTNVINHKLGRKLQGWSLTRKRAPGDVSDTQDTNQSPALTLLLVASAPMVVDIEVF